jgi:hypothetical protein
MGASCFFPSRRMSQPSCELERVRRRVERIRSELKKNDSDHEEITRVVTDRTLFIPSLTPHAVHIDMDQLGRQIATVAAFCESNPPTFGTLLGLGSVATGWKNQDMYRALADKWAKQQQQQQQAGKTLAPIVLPRIIWLYWETLPGRTKPAYLDACLDTIRAWNAGVRIVVVCPQNMHEQLTADELHPLWQRIGKVEQKADYVRVLLLARYGGVWMDMDTICYGSIVPFLARLERERRDLVLWQREVSYEMNNALIVVTPQHPVMVDALTRMHARFDVARARLKPDEQLHFENWTELGSMLYGDCVHAHLVLQHELVTSGQPLSTCLELRNMSEIEPFSWVDAREWTLARAPLGQRDTDAWLARHIRTKEARSETLFPVLSFPNALIEPEYKKRYASVTQLLAAADSAPHYLALALACALCSPSERDAVHQTATLAQAQPQAPPQCIVQ